MQLALFAIALLASTGCIIVDEDPVIVERGNDSSLTIENESDYAIAEIRVTEIDNPSWGPNLTQGDLLFPGQSMTVLLACDVYDVLVVDEDGFGCEINGLDLCFDDAIWVISNRTLDSCF